MSNRLYSALRARYKAQIIEAEADILNFFENPVAVAEHPHTHYGHTDNEAVGS